MKVKFEDLNNFLLEVSLKIGINEEQAKILISSYLEAELFGISTHGLNILPSNLEKIINKNYNINKDIIIEKDLNSFTKINANNLPGPISAVKAMNLTIDKARINGVHTTFVRNANTFGAASVYNKLAADKGLISIIMSNSPAQMAPINGLEKLVGTNPFAISIPGKTKEGIIFDMATSQVSKSRILAASKSGELLPDNSATDKFGNITTDPTEALQGLVMPMSGYKGYGLAVCIDIIGGLMSGAAYLNNVGRFYGSENCMNVGYTIIVMNPQLIMDDSFYGKVDDYINTIKRSKAKKGSSIYYPGEINLITRENTLITGIEISTEVLDKLAKLSNLYQIDLPKGI